MHSIQRLKLIAAAILVFRASTSLQMAPAAKPWRSAPEGRMQAHSYDDAEYRFLTPGHEYDRLQVADGSAAKVHLRMTDAADWLR